MTKKKPSYYELLQQRRRKLFIGREKERDAFHRNFGSDIPGPLIFAIHGQAGIGKSFLMDRYRTMAHDNDVLTALTNEAEATPIAEQSILKAMARLAKQLSNADAPLKSFNERYTKYRECMRQAESDPNAPRGAFDLLGRTAAQVMLGGVRMTPVGQAAEGFLKGVGVDSKTVVEQAGAWTRYLARKFKNKDEVILVKNPVETLTPLFVAGVNTLADKCPVVLCFDTWEWTGKHLDDWLRGLLEKSGLSIGVWLVIAGRNFLGNEWEPFHPLMNSFELKEFTEKEMRDYIFGQGITDDEARIADILAFSGGIPVLVSTLSSAKGGSAAEAADGLVDRYLKWVDDERKRSVALNCAAARRLDKDVVAKVMGEDNALELFEWLREMPFVQSRPGYWEYHPKVRKLMLQFARSRSLKDFRVLHGKLQVYYKDLLAERETEHPYRDELWRRYRLEALYHGLMAEQAEAERDGLEAFLLALKKYYPLLEWMVITWKQAAEEQASVNTVIQWANILEKAWTDINSNSWKELLAFCKALRNREDLCNAAESEVHFLTGLAYTEMQQYERALEDYKRAIELNPEYAAAYSNRGLTYHELQQYEQALEDYKRAIELNPEEAAAYSNRGNTYYKLQQYEQALEDYGRAIELNPEYAAAYYNKSCTFALMKHVEKACEWLRKAINLDEEHIEMARQDRDFDAIREQDYFKALMNEVF
jgi:tetratricopeptide (TPR) repeat protein